MSEFVPARHCPMEYACFLGRQFDCRSSHGLLFFFVNRRQQKRLNVEGRYNTSECRLLRAGLFIEFAKRHMKVATVVFF